MGLEKPLDKRGCCLSAETDARMELTMESREGPTTQDGTGHLMAVSRLLFEGTMATCHPSSIPDEVACKPCHTSGPSDSFGGNMMSTSPAVCT